MGASPSFRASGLLGALLVLTGLLVGPGAGTAAAVPPPHLLSRPTMTAGPASFVAFTGDEHEWVAAARPRAFTPADSTITAVTDGTEVHVEVQGHEGGEDTHYRLWLAAPAGERLRVGTYRDAQRTPFRAPGHPGVDVAGGGRGCDQVFGEWTLRELVVRPDGRVSRLSASYEQWCERVTDRRLYGELVLTDDPASPPLQLSGRSATWPETYPRTPASPWRVTARAGAAPVRLGRTAVTGPGAAAFRVEGDTCSGRTLPAGGACAVQLRFLPDGPGRREARLEVPVDGTGGATVALAGTGRDGTSRLTVTRVPAGGAAPRTWTYDPTTTVFTGTVAGRSGLHRWFPQPDGTHWHLELRTPVSAPIRLGELNQADNRSRDRHVWVGHHALTAPCGYATGAWRVHEAEYHPLRPELVTRIALTFVQRCDDGELVYGTYLHNALRPAPAAETPATLPFPPTRIGVVSGPGRAEVTWNEAVANGSPVTAYLVTAVGTGNELRRTTTVPASARRAVLTDLPDGRPLWVDVRAVTDVGVSIPGPTASAEPDASPITARWYGDAALRTRLGGPVGPTQVDGAVSWRPFQRGRLYSSTAGTHVVAGAILDTYLRLGGHRRFGPPLTDELPTPDGAGRYNHFARGASVYWTRTTGAHAVEGAIRRRWAALGWETGPMGYPVTSELPTPDGVARFTHFSRGASIYWSPGTGAHGVWGAIRSRWAALGWERGYLGLPVSSEYAVPGGRRSDFRGGSVTWMPGRGAADRRR